MDFADKNIRINAVCPGPIATNMISAVMGADPALEDQSRKCNPMQRFGEPEEVANAVVWLCSNQASYATGMIMTIDGGFSA